MSYLQKCHENILFLKKLKVRDKQIIRKIVKGIRKEIINERIMKIKQERNEKKNKIYERNFAKNEKK